MSHIVVDDEQARIISESAESIEIRDRSGKHLGYVTPFALLLIYLMVNREPVVAVRGSSVHLASPTFPWRKTIVASRDIVSIETDWLQDTSHARIVFCVTPERFAEQNRSGPWIKRKDGKLYLDVLNTDYTPQEAAANLRRVLGIPEPDKVA